MLRESPLSREGQESDFIQLGVLCPTIKVEVETNSAFSLHEAI